MSMVLLDRAFAGFLAGLLYGAGNTIIVRSSNPHRLTGILVGGSMIPSIALAYLIPVHLIPKFGVGAGFYALALSTLVASLFAIGLENKVSQLQRPERSYGRLNLPLILFAGAVVLQSCGLGAAWAYIERLANQHGFGPSIVAMAVAGSLASQVVAAWLSAWIVPKIAGWMALLALTCAQAGFIALCIATASSPTFVLAVCLFGSAASAMQAFQVAQILVLDPTRRTAVLVSPLVLLGNGFGPLIASFVTTEADVRGGAWAATIMTSMSVVAVLLLIVVVRSVRPPAHTVLQPASSLSE